MRTQILSIIIDAIVNPAPSQIETHTARFDGNTRSTLIKLDENLMIGLKKRVVIVARMTPRIRKLSGPVISTPSMT